MASGKSLELAAIPGPRKEALCVCGMLWGLHLKKKPGKHGYRERKKEFRGFEHRIVGTFERAAPKPTKAERRAHKRRRRGTKRAPA